MPQVWSPWGQNAGVWESKGFVNALESLCFAAIIVMLQPPPPPTLSIEYIFLLTRLEKHLSRRVFQEPLVLFSTSFFPSFPCKHDISTFPTTEVEERYLQRAHKRTSASGGRMPNISNHRAAFVEAISCVSEGTRLFPVFPSCAVKRRVVLCLSVTNMTADRRDVNQEVFAHISLRNSAGLETVLFLTLPWRFSTLSDVPPVGCVPVCGFLPAWLGWGLGSNQFRPVQRNRDRWDAGGFCPISWDEKQSLMFWDSCPSTKKRSCLWWLLTSSQAKNLPHDSCSMFSAEACARCSVPGRKTPGHSFVSQARCVQRLAGCTQVL